MKNKKIYITILSIILILIFSLIVLEFSNSKKLKVYKKLENKIELSDSYFDKYYADFEYKNDLLGFYKIKANNIEIYNLDLEKIGEIRDLNKNLPKFKNLITYFKDYYFYKNKDGFDVFKNKDQEIIFLSLFYANKDYFIAADNHNKFGVKVFNLYDKTGKVIKKNIRPDLVYDDNKVKYLVIDYKLYDLKMNKLLKKLFFVKQDNNYLLMESSEENPAKRKKYLYKLANLKKFKNVKKTEENNYKIFYQIKNKCYFIKDDKLEKCSRDEEKVFDYKIKFKDPKDETPAAIYAKYYKDYDSYLNISPNNEYNVYNPSKKDFLFDDARYLMHKYYNFKSDNKLYALFEDRKKHNYSIVDFKEYNIIKKGNNIYDIILEFDVLDDYIIIYHYDLKKLDYFSDIYKKDQLIDTYKGKKVIFYKNRYDASKFDLLFDEKEEKIVNDKHDRLSSNKILNNLVYENGNSFYLNDKEIEGRLLGTDKRGVSYFSNNKIYYYDLLKNKKKSYKVDKDSHVINSIYKNFFINHKNKYKIINNKDEKIKEEVGNIDKVEEFDGRIYVYLSDPNNSYIYLYE